MKTIVLVACCLLAANAQNIPIYSFSVPVVAPALHHTVIQPAVHTREHHSTTVEHNSGPTVVHHHPGVVESAVVHHQEPRVHAVVHHDVPAVENAIVHHHEPVVHEVLRPAVVAEHNELVYTPHHEHSYSLDQTKVVQPKSSVVEHHPLTGHVHRQTDYHHEPVVSRSRSSVHQSRPATIVHRTRAFLI
ncbi:uncharacterized protein LOC144102477 [Amblyomma americanum]